MRITSRIRLFLLFIGIACIIATPIGYFLNQKDDRSLLWVFIILEILFLFYSLIWLNCVDIYREADDKLRCYFYGHRFELPPVRRIRRLRLGISSAGWLNKFYRIGYISFRNEAGRRRLKFFVLDDRDWHLIDERGLS